jgi:hypothetical protein
VSPAAATGCSWRYHICSNSNFSAPYALKFSWCTRRVFARSSSSRFARAGSQAAIAKTGADCASLSFSGGAATKRAFSVDGGGYWTVSAGSVGPCGDAAAQAQIQGALGTLTLRKAGNDCVADLHATLFTIDNAGTVTTTRMDGDGIKMPSVLSVMSCP